MLNKEKNIFKKSVLKKINLNKRNNSLIIAYSLVIILFILGEMLSPGFLSFNQILNVLLIASFLGIIGAGQTFVILSGGDGIDLSVGSIMSLGAVMTANITMAQNSMLLYALLQILLMGMILGSINGLGVSYLKIPPLVMTLGMSGVIQGLILLYTKGQPKGRAAPFLNQIVTGKSILGIPGILIIWLILAIIIHLILKRTSFGRKIYAVGTNRKAARFSGLNTSLIVVLVYSISGMFSALTGFLFIGYTTTVFMNIGGDYVLRSVAAVVVGGTSLMGGKGNYLGTIAGAVVMTVLQAILTTLNMGEPGRQIVYGLVLIGLLTMYGRQKKLRE